MIERLETIREEQGEQQWLEVTRALIGHECSHIYHFDVAHIVVEIFNQEQGEVYS